MVLPTGADGVKLQTGCGVPGVAVAGVSGAAGPRLLAGLGGRSGFRRADGIVRPASVRPLAGGGWGHGFQVRKISLRAVEPVICRHQDLNSLTRVWPRSF